ncbi:helix-turn-helix domain-containing protein [Salinibacterium xinjiangense]|uniref:helix-turn-helix domain-containing protein n=1 Tax=Salinibacterium xinjiangense TaxID=386302 RepID=UPI000BE365FB
MKRLRHYSPETRRALSVLGNLIAAERRSQRRTQSDLAERVGISLPTLSKIERGSAGSEIGSVFELATILGIRLFPDVDDVRLDQRLALSPSSVRTTPRPVDDEF